ncbi:NADH dehydrogenase [ubiquinone] 1 alpha subcomplex subunit 7-like [Trichogramma pretiosum]|uniref:NADH dehydrogenase [ubiquinone] 1 alpha subcomplex subunit 7 n=1 Tax=Trichogramma kaykai TaxID=54128 RepID=A0ABD2WR35_9HYME|nr:NADH dehydrogenase [ubiquinone] 1 alpha subcomplex subunit 7-like [Trichogramma pretiosum]
MSGVQPHRTVTPLLDAFRTILRGTKLRSNPLRFADECASRTQPQPDLPGGPYDKTTGIYYYQRDGRREVQPPLVIASGGKVLLSPPPEKPKQITPGRVYNPE